MIYEWRTYDIAPGRRDDFMALFESRALPIRAAYVGVLEGFWTPACGNPWTVEHLWRYPSLDARAQDRQALAANAQWQETFVDRISGLVACQRSEFLHLRAGELGALKGAEPWKIVFDCKPFTAARTLDALAKRTAGCVFAHETANPHRLTWLGANPAACVNLAADDDLSSSWQAVDRQRLEHAAFSPLK